MNQLGSLIEVQVDPVYAAADGLTTWIAPQSEPISPLFILCPAEGSLILEMLIRAIEDAQNRKPYSQATREDAQAWFASGEKSAFSFLWTCDLLGLEPEAVRQSISKGSVPPAKYIAHIVRHRKTRRYCL